MNTRIVKDCKDRQGMNKNQQGLLSIQLQQSLKKNRRSLACMSPTFKHLKGKSI